MPLLGPKVELALVNGVCPAAVCLLIPLAASNGRECRVGWHSLSTAGQRSTLARVNCAQVLDLMTAMRVKPNTFTMNLIVGALADAGQVRSDHHNSFALCIH